MEFDSYVGIDWSGDKNKYQKGISVPTDSKNVHVDVATCLAYKNYKYNFMVNCIQV